MQRFVINKIPVDIADTRNIIDISIVGTSTIVLKYEVSTAYNDETTKLTEYRELSLSYQEKVVSFETEIDEEDNVFIKAYFKKPFSLFGYTFKKEE